MKVDIILLGTGGGEPVHITPYGVYDRKNTATFFRTPFGGILIDNPPDINYSLAMSGVKLSEIKYNLFTHGHKDHFHPELIATYKIGKYAILDEEFQRKDLYVFAGEDLIESYLTIMRRFRGNPEITETSDGFIIRGVSPAKIILKVVREGEETTLPNSGITITPLPTGHPSSNLYADYKGRALGYLISFSKFYVFYMSDFKDFSDQLLDILSSKCEERKMKAVILGCPLPLGEKMETPHLDLRGIIEAFNDFKGRGWLADGAKLILTHLSPRWIIPEVKEKALELIRDKSFIILPNRDGFKLTLEL